MERAQGPDPLTEGGAGPDVSPAPALIRVDVGPRARGWFTTRHRPAAPTALGDACRGSALTDASLGDGGPSVADDGAAGLGFNLAAHVGDDPAAVAANRALLEDVVGGPIGWMNQTHSVTVSAARRGTAVDGDAQVLDPSSPEAPVAAGVLVADCVPVLLASADGRLAAAVHAGRRGMLGGIVTCTMAALACMGAAPDQLWAVVGPSICGSCYELPEDVVAEAGVIEPSCATVTRWGTPGIDVAAGVRAQLARAGVAHVDGPRWCTWEDHRFFSYRRQGATGRIAGVVAPCAAAS